MDNLLLVKDLKTCQELQSLGCKLLKQENDMYVLVNCSNKLNYNDYKDRVIFTNRLTF